MSKAEAMLALIEGPKFPKDNSPDLQKYHKEAKKALEDFVLDFMNKHFHTEIEKADTKYFKKRGVHFADVLGTADMTQVLRRELSSYIMDLGWDD